MPVANLKENLYALPVAPQSRGFAVCRRLSETTSGSSFPFGSSARSISDNEQLSSFSFKPQIIDSLFQIEQAIPVHEFLRKNSSLFSILLRARAEAHWLFGALANVRLRMEYDPEGEFAPRLLLVIQTTLDAQRAVDRLDLLDDRWWLTVDSRLRSLMKIDVEYVQPI